MAALTTEDVQKVVENELEPIKVQVSELHEVFFGNGGSPGIKTEVAVIKTRLAVLYTGIGLLTAAALAIAVSYFGG